MMKLEAKFDCGQGAIRVVRFNKDGNYCITCGADRSIKLWNPYKQIRLQTYSGCFTYKHTYLCDKINRKKKKIFVKTIHLLLVSIRQGHSQGQSLGF